MTHLKRAAALLLGILVVAFIVPRVMPVPAFLEGYGFHLSEREANKAAWASLPMKYVSPSICNDCHQDQYSTWGEADHQTVSCENCHGPAGGHIEGKGLPAIDISRENCGLCHAQLVSRPGDFPQVDMESHGGQAECITCHNPHDPRAGMPPTLPHSTEGRTDCQSCHNPLEPLMAIPPHVPHPLEGHTDCLSCHDRLPALEVTVPDIPHSLEGRDNCLLCHNTSAIKPFPESHVGRTTDTCLNCHQGEQQR